MTTSFRSGGRLFFFGILEDRVELFVDALGSFLGRECSLVHLGDDLRYEERLGPAPASSGCCRTNELNFFGAPCSRSSMTAVP